MIAVKPIHLCSALSTSNFLMRSCWKLRRWHGRSSGYMHCDAHHAGRMISKTRPARRTANGARRDRTDSGRGGCQLFLTTRGTDCDLSAAERRVLPDSPTSGGRTGQIVLFLGHLVVVDAERTSAAICRASFRCWRHRRIKMDAPRRRSSRRHTLPY